MAPGQGLFAGLSSPSSRSRSTAKKSAPDVGARRRLEIDSTGRPSTAVAPPSSAVKLGAQRPAENDRSAAHGSSYAAAYAGGDPSTSDDEQDVELTLQLDFDRIFRKSSHLASHSHSHSFSHPDSSHSSHSHAAGRAATAGITSGLNKLWSALSTKVPPPTPPLSSKTPKSIQDWTDDAADDTLTPAAAARTPSTGVRTPLTPNGGGGQKRDAREATSLSADTTRSWEEANRSGGSGSGSVNGRRWGMRGGGSGISADLEAEALRVCMSTLGETDVNEQDVRDSAAQTPERLLSRGKLGAVVGRIMRRSRSFQGSPPRAACLPAEIDAAGAAAAAPGASNETRTDAAPSVIPGEPSQSNANAARTMSAAAAARALAAAAGRRMLKSTSLSETA